MFNWQTMYLRQKTAELVGGKIVRENFVQFISREMRNFLFLPYSRK